MAGKPQMHLRSVVLLRALMVGLGRSVTEFACCPAVTSRQCIDGLLKRGTRRRTTADAIATAVGAQTLDPFNPCISSKSVIIRDLRTHRVLSIGNSYS